MRSPSFTSTPGSASGESASRFHGSPRRMRSTRYAIRVARPTRCRRRESRVYTAAGVGLSPPRLVRVRRAELAVHLPDHVGQLVARAHLRQQRLVARQHGVPVDPRHLGVPEVLALQAPRFAQHLPPFGERLDEHADAREVQPAGAAADLRRRFVVVAVFRKIAARVDRAQLAVREVHQRARVGADDEVVDLGRERRAALLLEVVREQLAFRLRLVCRSAGCRAPESARRSPGPSPRRCGRRSLRRPETPAFGAAARPRRRSPRASRLSCRRRHRRRHRAACAAARAWGRTGSPSSRAASPRYGRHASGKLSSNCSAS